MRLRFSKNHFVVHPQKNDCGGQMQYPWVPEKSEESVNERKKTHTKKHSAFCVAIFGDGHDWIVRGRSERASIAGR